MASVQELLLAAQAKQKKSPLSALADLINAAGTGYSEGVDLRNKQSEVDLRRSEIAKKLIESEQLQREAQAQSELRKQFEEKIALDAEQKLRERQGKVAPPATPTTPAGKFTTEWSQDAKGNVSRSIKEVTSPTNESAIAGEKDQNKLYHQSVTNLRQFFSSRSGNFGSQDAKVNQAIHLGNLADQYYNPATKQHDIPEAQSSELVMGLANLVSGSNVTTVEGLKSITPKNFQSDRAHIISYWTGKPVTYQPEEMTKNLIDSIDRQGTVAEDLRNTYLQQGKDAFIEPGLNESNTKRLLGVKVGSSFKDFLATRPSAQPNPTPGNETPTQRKARLLQELQGANQ